MYFKWSGIEEFVKVAECGSFSKAAQSLNVSKSHVSKHIRRMEEQFGVILFNRNTRNVVLTNQGRDFFLKCQKILSNLEDAQSELIDEASELKGHINIAIAGAFGEEYIAPNLANFLVEYPEVSINMEFTNRLVNLQEEHFDLAIRSEFTNLENLSHEKICSYDLITAAHPDYLKNAPDLNTPDDLENHNCLIDTLPYWRFKIDDQVKKQIVNGNWRSNNGRALISAAKSTKGIIQLPNYYALEEISKGNLVEVLNKYAVNDINYYAVMSQLHYTPRRVSTLIKFLNTSLNNISNQ
ncbi:MAG: LysR family transcriptional regulator [Emcibacteraceae bacterium]|nr:LysR family transcriptional regulator [Emcibacteraceae bacterium]